MVKQGEYEVEYEAIQTDKCRMGINHGRHCVNGTRDEPSINPDARFFPRKRIRTIIIPTRMYCSIYVEIAPFTIAFLRKTSEQNFIAD